MTTLAFARWRGPALGVAGVAVLLLTIEVVSRAGIVDERFLPPFSSVLVATVHAFGDPVFLADLGSTLGSYALGMLIAAGVAIPLGVLLGLSRPTYRASRTVIELIRPIPPVALVPLALLVFGAGLQTKVVIVVFAAVWPILFNTIAGVHDVEPGAVQMGRTFGLGRAAIIRRIVIPSAAPFIMTGVRIASSIALIVVITVELIAGGADGLGAFIARERATASDPSLVFAGTLVCGLLGLAVNLVLGAIGRRFFAWDDAEAAR
ncbi:ABC transporter permease [Okibacterium endophyticum]